MENLDFLIIKIQYDKSKKITNRWKPEDFKEQKPLIPVTFSNFSCPLTYRDRLS